MPYIKLSTKSRTRLYSTDSQIAGNTHTAILTKGSAGAYTIGTPSQNGIRITVIADSNFQHTITGPASSFIAFDHFGQAPVVGSVLTFYTTPRGSVVEFESYNGKWYLGALPTVQSCTVNGA